VEALSAWLALMLFSRFADESSGLATVIVVYAAIPLAVAALVWPLVKEPDSVETPESVEDSAGRSTAGARLLLAAVRLPGVWLLTVVILAAYIAFWGGFDLSAFAERAFGKSAEFAATLSNYRMGFRAVAPVLAGIVADRLGASRTSAVLFVVLVLSFGLFSLMPVGPGWLWLLWTNTALASVAVFSLRGIYYALLEEAHIPTFMTGSATGIVSFLAYTPDAFIPVVNGLLLDRFPGTAGHRYYYLLIAATSVLGLLAALAIRWARGKSEYKSL
jgi:nitrate/nitrite transporter NarK